MSLPAWLNNPAVFCVLLPVEDADDPGSASAWMAKSVGIPGAFEVMPLTDPRWPEALHTFVASMVMRGPKDPKNMVMLLDKDRGLFRVEFAPPPAVGHLRPLGRCEDRLLRVLFLRGMAAPASGGQ